MTRSANTPSEELRRIPGLFRRWELPEVFEPHRHYHIEDAGTHADGTPLLAVYASEATASPVPPSNAGSPGFGSTSPCTGSDDGATASKRGGHGDA